MLLAYNFTGRKITPGLVIAAPDGTKKIIKLVLDLPPIRRALCSLSRVEVTKSKISFFSNLKGFQMSAVSYSIYKAGKLSNDF
jgi:hypothetical protein